jgi:dTDP-4-dehydrorhamnose 3,5-epimerase
MKFHPTSINGVFRAELEQHVDDRGFFARSWCAEEFKAAEFPGSLAQCSISWNERQHTLRGMHWQSEPHGEVKIVRCTRGRILDVVVDLRPESPTYLHHLSLELTQENRFSLLIPPNIAHGFMTLTAECEVHYQMDVAYVPKAARGARWNDPAFRIAWPASPEVISERDRTYPNYERHAPVLGRQS